MFNLFRHELTSRRWTILGWGIGLALFAAIYIFIYPEMAAEVQGLAGLSLYRAMGIDLGSFAGFIASVVVQIMPIILGVYVIIVGTGTLAGEEENGTLELVVAMPLPRWQIVLMKSAAILVAIFLIVLIFGVLTALELVILGAITDLTIDTTPIQLFVALLGAYPLMVAVFGISLFFSAFMPSRRLALIVVVLIYIYSYLLNSVSMIVESLEWVASLSLFGYLNATAEVFENGVALGDMAVLLGVGLLFIALAVVSFQGRNLTVGQWVWQRGRVPASS